MALDASAWLPAPNIPVEVRQERRPLAFAERFGSAPPGLQVITGAPHTIAVPMLPIGSLLGDRDCSASNGHRDMKARSTGCVVLWGQRRAQIRRRNTGGQGGPGRLGRPRGAVPQIGPGSMLHTPNAL